MPGLINVDFEDVRTVMAEMGMAMMGSAYAAGIDRARVAAEQAVASPLLEGVNLSGARGVVVNITASDGLKMREVHEVMNTIQSFAADDAHIIFGAVYDEAMGDDLRVTVVATGLGNREVAREPEAAARRAAADRHRQRRHPGRRLRHARKRARGLPQEPQLDDRGAVGERGRQVRHPRFPAQAGRLIVEGRAGRPLTELP